jgi:hypothetical protein
MPTGFRMWHDRSVLHKLPPIPFFRVSPPTDPIQEAALRVIVELPGGEFHVIGTAAVIGSYLAITAKHVLDEAEKFQAREGYSLRLYQVLPRPPGPSYRIWGPVNTWVCESDIAILHLGLDRTYGDPTPEARIEWKSLRLRLTPPPTGHVVCAFGYSRIKTSCVPGFQRQSPHRP